MSDNSMQMIGSWAFILGVLLAVAAAFVTLDAVMLTSGLVVLGLVVGFLNVTGQETKDFLLTGVALVIVSGLGTASLGAVPTVGHYLGTILTNIMTMVIPAVVVVCLKSVHSLAKD